MNRFFEINRIPSDELLPWQSRKLGLSETTGQFVLRGELYFASTVAHGTIGVPAGFTSDLASIPGAAAWFMDSDDQRIAGGAWIHDYLYQHQGRIRLMSDRHVQLTRRECDRILCFEAMADLGATKLQQRVVYWALRIFGNRWKAGARK